MARRSTIDWNHNERWAAYEAAVAMVWRDARLSAEELSAVRAIAEELGLVGQFSLAGAVLRSGVSHVHLTERCKSARLLIYATAAWAAWADGSVHPQEDALLEELRDRLALDDNLAGQIERAAQRHAETSRTRESYRSLVEDCATLEPPIAPSSDEPT